MHLRNQGRIQLGATTEDGFKDELLDFRNNLLNRRVESRLVSHQLSYDIAEALYKIRKLSGISYPCFGEENT
jgi:hypothetical protein